LNALFMILGVLAGLIGLGCYIVILIAAFRDELWKGLLSIFCGLYGLYYALAEFDHENKLLIILGAVGGNVLSYVFYMMAIKASA
jgi:hypothetical protein